MKIGLQRTESLIKIRVLEQTCFFAFLSAGSLKQLLSMAAAACNRSRSRRRADRCGGSRLSDRAERILATESQGSMR